MRGATYAFTSVVDTRSNSGPRGITSCDSEMCSTSGNSSSTISRVRRSCSRVHEREQVHHRDRAHAELLQALHAAAHRLLVERRGRPCPCGPCARGSGCAPAGGRSGSGPDTFGSQISSLWQRRSSISSRWPSVTSRPVFAPFISIIVLSAVVVPCTRMSSCGAELAERETEAVGELPEPVHHAARLVVERARRLVEHDLAGGRDADEVGERAPDVDPDAVAHAQRLGRAHARRGAASVAASSIASVRSSREPVSTTP